jgi:hypothetical protein
LYGQNSAAEKFVRPDLSKTGIQCYGSAGWKCESR